MISARQPALAQIARAPNDTDELTATSTTKVERIEVRARPIDAFDLRDKSRRQFGSLRFRSGLVLSSGFRGFGGLSALRLDPKGERFVALSDHGSWFTGRIIYSGSDMTGLADVEAAPLLGADGVALNTRGWHDSESLAFDGGTAYVGLERVNQIVRFDFGRDGFQARGQPIVVPQALRHLPNNKGIEALVFVPKGQPLAGTLIALSERGLDADRNIMGFLIGGKTPGVFSVRRTQNFDISDAALLPGGELLILERKFSWLEGVHIRIRRIALNSIVPGALIDGPVIFDADMGMEIDNLEGLDVFTTADGETVLTMISDDNFSMLQRTMLLQFTLAPE
ncbi:esterase-like activity of phytase family protein [Rhodopseudomonas sp. B29]|uniref:esterase-like activity of phytase family protein n=1 Tax=Rhodopseudomonas sp. B29 TaxID=95607 RepID=UPI0035E3E430